MVLPVLLFISASVLGNIGQSLGVPRLFIDEVNPLSVRPDIPLLFRLLSSAAFATQVYSVALFGLTWTLIVLMEQNRTARETGVPDNCRRLPLLATIVIGAVLLSLLPFAAGLAASAGNEEASQVERGTLLVPFLGAVAGFVFFIIGTVSALEIAGLCRLPRLQGVIGFSAIILVALTYVPVALPAKAIFILAGWFVLAYTSFYLLPSLYRFPAIVGFALLAALTNSVGEKYLFPTMETLYDKRVVLEPPTSEQSDKRLQSRDPQRATEVVCAAGQDDLRAESDGLIQPVRGLQTWYSHLQSGTRARTGKPKLVVVASSGGGYRATFWNALVLDLLHELELKDAAFTGLGQSTRLLTGASGGMVASAYRVADLAETKPSGRPLRPITELIEKDIREAQLQDQRGIPNPIIGTRDSLSSIVRELLKYDMPGVLWPFRRTHDRGRELESHWSRLEKTAFHTLLQGEREGWLPHLIFSPVLVETGQPLFITNLDLATLTNKGQEAVEFFKVFPAVRRTFRLSTAARMNATFPFVSPATQLPTIPPRRVVDAAYYDNFGIAVAVAFLEQADISAWIKKCTDGIVLLQVRAFRIEELLEDPKLSAQAVAYFGRFDWVAAPLQGAVAARDSTMRYRNNRELTLLRRVYGEKFLETVVLEPRSSKLATMTWVVSEQEFRELKADIESLRSGPELSRLRTLWQGNSTH